MFGKSESAAGGWEGRAEAGGPGHLESAAKDLVGPLLVVLPRRVHTDGAVWASGQTSRKDSTGAPMLAATALPGFPYLGMLSLIGSSAKFGTNSSSHEQKTLSSTQAGRHGGLQGIDCVRSDDLIE